VSHACCGEPDVGVARLDEAEVSPARRGAAASAAGQALADALAYAAAPTFALLALWTAFTGDRSDMSCMGMHDPSSLNGMALMYALMSAFHASPWLKRISPP
jgi:hypothetical protein